MNYETQIAGMAGGSDPMMVEEAERRRRRILIVAAIGALLLIIAAVYLGYQRKAGPDEAKGDKATIPNVTVIVAQPGAVVRTVSGTGALAARRDMPVGVVGEGGRVLSVLVEPGTWVKAGQVLAVIERSVQSEQVAQLAAQVKVAEANAKLAEANLARARALVGNGFISKADLDKRVADRDSAVAQVNVAIAQLNQSRANLGRLDIRAPANGLVLTRNVEAGQVVSGGSGTLFRIAKDGEMEMQIAINEGDLSGIEPGDKAQVTPVGNSLPIVGTVWQVAPVVDPQTRQGNVRVLLPYSPAIRPGAFASATVTTGHEPGILLPESAVHSDGAGSYVYIVDAHNKVDRRNITIAEVSDNGVAVGSGLSGGEHVVMTAGGFLNAGDMVRPVLAAGK